jgi:hypothetical protein
MRLCLSRGRGADTTSLGRGDGRSSLRTGERGYFRADSVLCVDRELCEFLVAHRYAVDKIHHEAVDFFGAGFGG